MSFARLLLLPLWLAAAPASPEPARPPATLALPGYRFHLIVGEELDPDLLRSLARPGVVLWMRTRSNMLRTSIAEGLSRFEEAYVELRPPLLEAQATQLRTAPGAGMWLAEEQLGGAGLYRLGGRRLAIEVVGPLDAARASRLRRARPTRITWRPDPPPDLEAWALFAQLPGAKLLDLRAGPAPWEGCPEAWPRGAVRTAMLRIDWTGPGAPAVPPGGCSLGARVRVGPGVSDEALARLFAADPKAELELDAGSDEATLRGARALLERLEAASPMGVRGKGGRR